LPECLWVERIECLYRSRLLISQNCGAGLRIIAFITNAARVQRILTHIGEPAKPLPISPARGPPGRDDALEPLPD
jgi:hypothetical protein